MTMQSATSEATDGRHMPNGVHQIGTKLSRAVLPRLFDAILFVIAIPRRVRFAFTDYAAAKKGPTTMTAASAPTPANDQGASARAPSIVFTPEAKGIVALSRENPKLAILIACLIMGVVQVGLFALTIFMLRDAGYSSGWGDATKYYINCESSANLQKWGQ